MEDLLGTSWPVFIGLTVVLFGGASFLMGHALAETWRPAWQCALYAATLGAADRFLTFALFEGELLTIVGYVVHSAVLVAIAFAAYRLTQVHKMVAQYPWLYERGGPFTWRLRPETDDGNPRNIPSAGPSG